MDSKEAIETLELIKNLFIVKKYFVPEKVNTAIDMAIEALSKGDTDGR